MADVSITGRGEKRPTPNPNVLIELGYAFKALGHERVILVFNRAFGKIEELPPTLSGEYEAISTRKVNGPGLVGIFLPELFVLLRSRMVQF